MHDTSPNRVVIFAMGTAEKVLGTGYGGKGVRRKRCQEPDQSIRHKRFLTPLQCTDTFTVHPDRSRKMKSVFANLICSAITPLLLLYAGLYPCNAEAPKVPLARASDLNFSVEYSTDRLMVGDILYAKTVIRNKTDAKLRIEKFDLLFIYAKTPDATELVCRDGCSGPNGGLVELAPGQSIVCHQVLNVFGDDGQEDGSFNPFDATLENQEPSLHASRSTIPGSLRETIGSPKYVMTHEHKIRLGAPLIEKKVFDDAVVRELESEDLKPLKLPFSFYNFQTSYLFTLAMESRNWNSDPRAFAACLRVLSRELPKQSSVQRAASVMLAADQFSLASPDAEEEAISAIISLLSECVPIEREFWKHKLAEKLQVDEIGFYRKPIVPKEKYDRFVRRLEKAGI